MNQKKHQSGQMFLNGMQSLLEGVTEKQNLDTRLAVMLDLLNEFIYLHFLKPDPHNFDSCTTDENIFQVNHNLIYSVRKIAYQLLESKNDAAKNSLRDVYEFVPIHLEELEPTDLIFVATNILQAAFIHNEDFQND